MPFGVQFPADHSGRRSTSRFGRDVVADALRGVDDVAAGRARTESDWRGGYQSHFVDLVSAGAAESAAAVRVAEQGLAALRQRMQWVDAQGVGSPLGALTPAPHPFGTQEVVGTVARAPRLEVPVGDTALHGSALEDQLDEWVRTGAMEPSAAASVRAVAANPEWLSLPGRTLVALGAGAEVGPLSVFLAWGARVVAVDLPRPHLWDRVTAVAKASAGTLVVPTRTDGTRGVDLLTELPQLMSWVAQEAGAAPVLGNFLYADGGTNVRVAAAGDALARSLVRARPDTTLGFLATPTDAFVVPEVAVAASREAWSARPFWSEGLGVVLGKLSRGALLQPNYADGPGPHVVDSLVAQQGPNYALGKRVHRWQAVEQFARGRSVSMNVAPSTRTRSVTKNKALAAAYAGAHHYGVRVFEPDTTRALMAALLVHDLYGRTPTFGHPADLEAHQATHGGLWRVAYAPRSALTLAAVLGLGKSLRG